MSLNGPHDLGENSLLALAIRAVTLIAIVLILAIAGCVIHADYQSANAIAHGADPVAVSCALQAKQGDCALAAARGVKP